MQRRRTCLFLCFFALIFLTRAQFNIQGALRDATTNRAVPFCAVGVKHKSTGTLSNEDGIFRLNQVFTTDTLVIINPGYKTKTIAVTEFQKKTTIDIEQDITTLQEVVVYNDENVLYELLETSRKNLLTSGTSQSKAYFTLSTEAENQAVEFIECYYNASQDATAIKELNFKNGRVGIAPIHNRYFVSLNTSKAITFLDLINDDEKFPLIPFQCRQKKLKKSFKLKLLAIYQENGQSIYHIAFKPFDNSASVFSGECWINKTNGQLSKIKLQATETPIHPFIALFPNGKIENVSLQIIKSFANSPSGNYPQHIDFNYRFNYRIKDSIRHIESNGLMYFYDYKNPFTLPHFNYNSEADDYRKISMLSYNEQFWNLAKGLVYSKQVTRQLSYFSKKGTLINYQNDGNLKQGLSKNQNSIFETGCLVWSGKTRLNIKNGSIKHDSTLAKRQSGFVFEQYAVKAQIFFDMNECADTVAHFSATILDLFQTFYHLEVDESANCFINVYFDLIEAERRKMEREMKASNKTKEALEKIYTQTLENIKTLETAYFKEVKHGKEKRTLKRYSDKVMSEIGIDNFNIFALSDK